MLRQGLAPSVIPLGILATGNEAEVRDLRHATDTGLLDFNLVL
jgi:hypothetical protein